MSRLEKTSPLLHLKFSPYVLWNHFKLSSVKIRLKPENSFLGCHLKNRWEGSKTRGKGPSSKAFNNNSSEE